MLNLHKELKREKTTAFEYEDEKIISTLYLSSLSYSLRSLQSGKLPESEIKRRTEANQWLAKESQRVFDVPTLNLDVLKTRIDSHLASCDALFYNGGSPCHDKHFIGEFKNTSKSRLIELMESEDSDSLKLKITSSLELLKNKTSFSQNEASMEGLTGEIHFFLVYGGKNDTAAEIRVKDFLPRKQILFSRDAKTRQNKASNQMRGTCESEKETDNTLSRFSSFIQGRGLSPCTKEEFPGATLPKLSKSRMGKIRQFSIFSAKDFADIVDNGYFDGWSWGELAGYMSN